MSRLAKWVNRQPTLRQGEGHVETPTFGLAARQAFQRLDQVPAKRLALISAPVVEGSAVAHRKSSQKLAVVEGYGVREQRHALVADLARRVRVPLAREEGMVKRAGVGPQRLGVAQADRITVNGEPVFAERCSQRG